MIKEIPALKAPMTLKIQEIDKLTYKFPPSYSKSIDTPVNKAKFTDKTIIIEIKLFFDFLSVFNI